MELKAEIWTTVFSLNEEGTLVFLFKQVVSA